MSTEELNLADIPGLGPVRRAALAEAGIEDLPGLLRLKVAELAAIRGVGIWQARKIAEFLRQRGLVLEVEVPGTGSSVVMVSATTPEEAAVVTEAVETLRTQAAIEARIEAEVEALEIAVADETGNEVETAAETCEAGPVGEEREEAVSASEEEPAEREEGLADWEQRIIDQREQLPEAAIELMDAIRAAAVEKQLTRQITRLLITAGEFLGDKRELAAGRRKEASAALEQAERTLRQAVEKHSFSPKQQREVAERIRRRRKELERLLERE